MLQKSRRIATLLAGFTLLVSRAAFAQGDSAAVTRPFHTVDRIVAIVGARPILLSRVQEEINMFRTSGGKVPTDSAELGVFLKQTVDRLVSDELMVQIGRAHV